MKHSTTRAIFAMDGYCVWDPSLVTDAAGKHHLFFSRWPISAGFEAWVTHSEVCRATAETPFGPYHFAEVVLPKRPGYWDGDVTHNPSVRRFGERYYLYYNGNQSDGGWWDHRNNQRVGVAVADRPEGPWTRFDKPLLDVTPGAWDAKVTTNPSCAQAPDGRYILVYKGVGDRLPPPKYGPVLHGVAFADRPEGPFVKHPEPIFVSADAPFPGEDPFVWCQDGRYFALIKDQGTYYSPAHRAIVRFESEDGQHWALSEDPVFQEKALLHSDGRREEVHRLERPFLYCTENGPVAFFCGVKPHADRHESVIAVMLMQPMKNAGDYDMLKTTALVCAATLTVASAVQAADKFPDFVNKVQLWNCGGAEPTADGKGVLLYRAPKAVRDQLDTKTPDGTERSGAAQMRAAAHSEIRFVLNEGAKREAVKLHLRGTNGASLVFFWGDVLAGESKLMPGDKARPVTLPGHGLLDSLMDKFPRGRFSNSVCRVVVKGAEVVFNGIDGDVRPPKPEELAPVMLSYGTSISQGAAASRPDLAWNALTARALGHDFINMGSSGTAFCEPAMADYLAGLKWDLCVLELSVNMAGTGFTTEQFKERAGSLIDKLAKAHPQASIVCISLFPYGTGDLWKQPRAAEYRKALEELCKASGHKNVHFVSGPDLLSFTGLSEDLLHPSDHGMIEIATKLAPRIREWMSGKD